MDNCKSSLRQIKNGMKNIINVIIIRANNTSKCALAFEVDKNIDNYFPC